VNALQALFTPGTTVATGVKVRGDTSVRSGQIIPLGDGWSTVQITVPWRAYSINTVAA
jgi:hypothetical protein